MFYCLMIFSCAMLIFAASCLCLAAGINSTRWH